MFKQRIIGTILAIVSCVLIYMGAGIVCILTIPIAILFICVEEFEVDDYDDSNY